MAVWDTPAAASTLSGPTNGDSSSSSNGTHVKDAEAAAVAYEDLLDGAGFADLRGLAVRSP